MIAFVLVDDIFKIGKSMPKQCGFSTCITFFLGSVIVVPSDDKAISLMNNFDKPISTDF